MSRIRRDLKSLADTVSSINTDVTALKQKGWCIDGTVLAAEKFYIRQTGDIAYPYAAKNDCYLVVDVHVNNGGSGSINKNSYVRLEVGGVMVHELVEGTETYSDNSHFGVHVKKGATATLRFSPYSYEDGSFVQFTELKLS